jgi:hypothetical protein
MPKYVEGARRACGQVFGAAISEPAAVFPSDWCAFITNEMTTSRIIVSPAAA